MSRLRRTALVPFLLAFALARGALAGELMPVTPAGSNPGELEMFEYLPAGLPPGAPLVVVLHGCTQTAAELAGEAGWLELADRLGLALLAPQQTLRNNPSRCFQWFQDADNQRDQGEALSIRQMVGQIVGSRGLDADRVYVTGLSAGGYMTTTLLALYPEVFAGGAVLAGGPHGCADDLASALVCMNGTDRSPEAWAEAVRGASGEPATWPRISVWHGSDDATVDDANAHELIEQWRALHDLLEVEPTFDELAGHPRTRYGRPSEAPAVELVTLARMGHAVPVRPGGGPEECGAVGPYAADVGVCGALEIARFWQLTGDPGDGDPGGGDPGGGEPGGGEPGGGDPGGGEAGDGGCQVGSGAESGSAGPLLVLAALALGRRRANLPR